MNNPTLEAALYALVCYATKVFKPNDKSELREQEYDCLAVPNILWKLVKKDIQDIITCTQQLDMAQKFHAKDIKLLLKTATKHFL